jgi:hypothetical protein
MFLHGNYTTKPLTYFLGYEGNLETRSHLIQWGHSGALPVMSEVQTTWEAELGSLFNARWSKKLVRPPISIK